MNNGKFRIRKLINGLYVAEKAYGGWPFKYWKGIDKKTCGFTWGIGERYYDECIGTYGECVNALAWHGVAFIEQDKH